MEETKKYKLSRYTVASVALLLSAALFILTPALARAQTYGGGLYGASLYGTGESSDSDEEEESGGGGGSRRTSVRDVTVASTSPEQTPARIISFPRSLGIGMEGPDVSLLQTLLRELGYYTYPEITGYFGTMTKAAVIAFQAANGIEQIGDAGPLTRARLTTLASNTVPSLDQADVPASNFDRDLALGATGEDVKALQKYLNSAGYVLATSGPGSPGNETTYFGSVTFNALVRFQEAHAAEILTPAGLTKGTGFFGASTRSFMASSISGSE